jgi:hypothetical protein
MARSSKTKRTNKNKAHQQLEPTKSMNGEEKEIPVPLLNYFLFRFLAKDITPGFLTTPPHCYSTTSTGNLKTIDLDVETLVEIDHLPPRPADLIRSNQVEVPSREPCWTFLSLDFLDDVINERFSS